MNGSPNSGGYRVLARKYRPRDFDELIGQDALVRTLSNAIAIGRVAHAFILTGVRGVGKTTTARIIARALNCIGPDGQGGPTIKPCGECKHCTAIAEDRHVDVIEIDAASRTGIDDIRELIESLRYKPVSARNKIYIVDEVHMLSRQAFNGLLKTLEEPPDNVVFVFATTEIRKVPVTVLSRCQRFDLRRIDSDALAGHFAMVSKKEGVEIEPAAIDIIARAADGSVRDGLSLLDQAMAMSGKGITAAQIRDMLGLADRVAVFDLFDSVMSGDIAAALDRFQAMHRDGADPVIVIQDLLEVTHWLTRIKIAPALAEEPGVPEEERVRGAKISQSLTMPVLSRCWQMLLKGLGETQMAPAPFAAAEMLLIRMTHAADLPPPADLIKSLQSDTPAPTPVAASTAQSSAAPAATSLASGATGPARPSSAAAHAVAADPAPLIGPEAVVAADMAGILRRYEDVIALFDEKREGIMTAHLRQDVHLVGFSQHRIEFRPGPNAPRDLANRMGRMLSDWTGERWIVSVSDAPGAPTLAEQSAAAKAERLAEAERDPLVRAVKETFPGARIRGITDRPKGATPDNQENSET
jgi:DNA polymerase-3 subunit gamma/tau